MCIICVRVYSTRCRRENRKIISQAVFGLPMGASGSVCRSSITNRNYEQQRVIPIMAKLDFKYDRTQVRNVTLVLKAMVAGVLVERKNLGGIEVNMILLKI